MCRSATRTTTTTKEAKTIPRRTKTNVSIAVDNQASLQAHGRRKNQPGSYIINEIQSEHKKITKKHPNITIKFRWVPGHEDLPGSDRVDEQAKKAAEGSEQNKNTTKGILKKELPASKAAIRQELRRRLKVQTEKALKKSPRYERIASIDPTAPSNKYRKICKKIPRRSVSILTQLRTGHIPLAAYLHRFKLADSPTCQQCKNDPETPLHYIKYCKAFKDQRRQLKTDIGPDKDIGLELLGDIQTIRHILKYITSTKRFEESHGNVDIPEREEDEDQDGITWT
jgi:hypothetical protein